MSSRPWLARYDPGVPHSLEPYPDDTIVDTVRRRAAERPAAAALRFEGRVISYRDLVRDAEAFAAALQANGIGAGDRIALVLPNCPQFVIAELGAWMAQAIIAPVNPTYPDEELAGLLNRAGATVVVTLSPFYEWIKAIQARTSIRLVIVAYVHDVLPPIRSLLFRLLRARRDGHRVELRGGDQAMRRLMTRHRGASAPRHALRPDDPAVLLPSGGTTGTPKWVLGAHRSLTAAGRQLGVWLDGVLTPWRDTLLIPLPLFHVYGCVGVQSLAFERGLSLSLVANPRDVAGLLATIRRDRPAFLCSVPTLLTALMSHSHAERTRPAFRAIKLCFSGAAPLMAETKRRFEELTGGVVMEGYSLTEAQMAVIANPALGEKKTGSVGLPLPDVNIRLVDVETGANDVPHGHEGEVLISAPQLMLGYWEQADETATVVRVDAEGRRWLHTGDIGFLDPEGYLFLTDRKKDLIKVSGYQVWPREVEEALSTHPAVLEVGVTGIPHEMRGEVPKAWVVLRPGAQAKTSELRAFCRERLAPYKVPAEIAIVPELPKSPVGKVLRRRLRELDAPQHAPEDSATAPM